MVAGYRKFTVVSCIPTLKKIHTRRLYHTANSSAPFIYCVVPPAHLCFVLWHLCQCEDAFAIDWSLRCTITILKAPAPRHTSYSWMYFWKVCKTWKDPQSWIFFSDQASFCYASRQTHKVWRPLQGVGYNYFFSRGRCHLLLGLKQGYPFYSPYGCRLGYHQSEAWPVEQKALPPQFYVANVTTGIRTHTLVIKDQRLNPVLLTARPWHGSLFYNLPVPARGLLNTNYSTVPYNTVNFLFCFPDWKNLDCSAKIHHGVLHV